MKDLIKNISVLSVKERSIIAPTQNNLAEEETLARDLYIINCQGLWFGNGFCFICCWRHRQRIILKAGAIARTCLLERLYLKQV
jgi:hypothetical protein